MLPDNQHSRKNRAGAIAERSGCGRILGNSDIGLIGNDFPIESKVFRHLVNDSFSIRPCSQASHATEVFRIGEVADPGIPFAALPSVSSGMRDSRGYRAWCD
jgi:hypothetical protein